MDGDQATGTRASRPRRTAVNRRRRAHGNFYWLCGGRLVVGPDAGVTLFAALLTAGASFALWALALVPDGRWLELAAGVCLCALTLAMLALAATTDPGVVPRGEGVDDAEADACAQERRVLHINGVEVPLKWCYTCRIHRPPRSAHCSDCGVCVAEFDHHCPWVGQCVGGRNYRYFFAFVATLSVLCAFTAACSARYIGAHEATLLPLPRARHGAGAASGARHAPASLRPPPPDGTDAPEADAPSDAGGGGHEFDPVLWAQVVLPLLMAVLILAMAVLCCVGPLACYHAQLTASNRTTNEEIKGLYAVDNPFSRGGITANCRHKLCAPLPPSYTRGGTELIQANDGSVGGRGGSDSDMDESSGADQPLRALV